MKQIVLSLFILSLVSGMSAQEKKFDPTAIMILDRMSDTTRIPVHHRMTLIQPSEKKVE